MPPAWTAPCAPASTGRWGRSNFGTPPACRETVARMKAAGEPVSADVERLLAAGADSWYRD